jgi:hypothetical protein
VQRAKAHNRALVAQDGDCHVDHLRADDVLNALVHQRLGEMKEQNRCPVGAQDLAALCVCPSDAPVAAYKPIPRPAG